MLKKYFLIVLFFYLSFLGNTYAQKTYIPDDNFEQALIDLGIDKDGVVNDSVATSDISGVLNLEITSKAISDLTGIEDFASLIFLDCRDNEIDSLNIDQNKELKKLDCIFNNMSFLQVNGATSLDTLKCFNNKLSRLNVSQNKNLKLLHCNANVLTTLNVNGATNLTDLECIGNDLTDIDISQNTSLTNFRCSDNLIANINIFNNLLLKSFYCDRNQITNVDLSNNTSLIELECWDNQIEVLDIGNNTDLKIIKCHKNNIQNLNLSNHTALNTILCQNNNLNFFNLKNGNNKLISDFDTKNNPNLLCIQVDDPNYSQINWTNKDAWTIFNEDCTNIGMPPIAVNDEYSTFVNTTLTVNRAVGVLTNDTDPEGKPLTAVLENDVSNGSLTLSPDGSFIYTPTLNFNGLDTFTYLANNGTLNSIPATVTINLQKTDIQSNIIVPNGFTPNGDQINDYFKPIYMGMKIVRLEIYNTWGNLIYVEENEVLLGWDGKVKNKNAENGNYLYKISAISINDEEIKLEDMFTLIR